MPVLTKPELDAFLKNNTEWKLEDGKLIRDWSFRDFAEAMEFVNRIARVAEAANHHPDIDIRYNRVRLGLISHDAGGITTRDSKMAAQIDQNSK